jgi:hypothetical protein
MREVLARWARAEDFYAERDNRTELEVKGLAAYANQPVEIVVDPVHARAHAVQQAALVACNLTSRWARSVTVIAPEVELCPELRRDGFTLLGERIMAEMRSADPFGSFTLREASAVVAEGPPPLRLFVGPWDEAERDGEVIAPDDYVAHAFGWTALGRRGRGFGPGHAGRATVAAAALAACVGAADLFKRAVGHERGEWVGDYSWCTWSQSFSPSALAHYDPRPIPSELHLGSVLLAGVGAIGSALAYLADFMALRGRLVFLDRDRIETSNLNRSPLFTVWDVLAGAVKTDSVSNYLSRHEGLRLGTVTGTWAENGARLAREGFDVWVSLTNEEGAWAQVPFQLPPVVLHGTTTSGWGFGAGRHIPKLDDCTMCRLPRPAAQFRGPCAEGEVGGVAAPAGARASLPFLSAASAALVLAELLKLGEDEYPSLPNDVSADLRYGLPAVVAVTRVPTEECEGCRASRSKLWESRGGAGRYRPYSEAA